MHLTSFKDLEIKKAYSSDFDDILEDFYVPALKRSVQYLRLAGFFSSTCLAVAARGISGLIRNGGEMKLIVSPRLSDKDLNIIRNTFQNSERIIEEQFLLELENVEDNFIKDHLAALGWLISNQRLNIR